ncbi:MAG: asparagine synthase (glutamine-hydrolyzing) [Oligoflexia bacterium]|nr:asparagine synthase (glutamine-hydrolyzing) [Oligoflexia bacterium]
MCGITGLFSTTIGPQRLSELGQNMTKALRHRGPDDHGEWLSQSVPLFFGHRRLSIVDLSPLGHQPMSSASGRYMLTFNGEIFNYQSLRKELEASGASFRGTSDTEVMLAAFEQWGPRVALENFVGQFAFGLWDQSERVLHIARDRFGEKPLYYSWQNGYFCFASELKALEILPRFQDVIDRSALLALAKLGYVPSPGSIFENVYKLPQASILSLSVAELSCRPQEFSPYAVKAEVRATPRLYWDLVDIANSAEKYSQRSEQEWIDHIEAGIREAVRLQMVADVPVGAFLSGGVDSSTIVAMMQQQSAQPVRTFSIGFSEKIYNEAPFAAKIARHFGTTHTEMTVTPNDCLDVIPLLPAIYDEPFADSSQIPTFLVSKLACSQVTVSLSGDAGDELFGGYLRYGWSYDLHRLALLLPRFLTKGLHSFSRTLPNHVWSVLGAMIRIGGLGSSVKDPGTKARRVAELVECRDFTDLYRKLVSLWSERVALVDNAFLFPTPLSEARLRTSFKDNRQLAMLIDQLLYLPDDILIKVDRAAMAVSLECRVPFLDHRLVQSAWEMPLNLKFKNGQTKWILRQILSKYCPRKLFERPKMGFAVPLDAWLRGPLRDWAEDLLSVHRLKQQGYFNPDTVRKEWMLHLSGKADRQYALWPVLMFEAWLANRDYRKSVSETAATMSVVTPNPV